MGGLYTTDVELYDIAFGWDVEEEVEWLLDRLDSGCVSVLEPGCGSGRMLEPLARRGLEVGGIDQSAEALELARRRLAPHADRVMLVRADMADFDLGRRFDGAICPINTLLHLPPHALAAHLECVAGHLAPGARYLAQVGLVDRRAHHPFAGSHWEARRGETALRVDWVDEALDAERGISRQRSRIEVLSGPRAGDVREEVHELTAWTPERWARAVETSPFRQVATYDAGRKGSRPPVPQGSTGGLLWHELLYAGS